MFNYSRKSQPLHVIMVHQPIKERVLLLWLEGAIFNWAASGYKFNIINITLLPLAYFCTRPFGTCSSLYITFYFVVVCTFGSSQPFMIPLLAFSVLHCSSFYSDQVSSSFLFTHFVSDLFQQPFSIFISSILKFVQRRTLAKCCW